MVYHSITTRRTQAFGNQICCHDPDHLKPFGTSRNVFRNVSENVSDGYQPKLHLRNSEKELGYDVDNLYVYPAPERHINKTKTQPHLSQD